MMPVNEAMFPVPLAANPIEVLVLLQVKLVAVPLNVIAVVALPLHNTWSVGSDTVGVGWIVIVKLSLVPLQL